MQQEIAVSEDQQPITEAKTKSPGIRPLLRTLKRKVFLIIGVAGITTISGLPLTKSNVLPVYQGNFQLLVEPITGEQKLSDPLTLTRSDGQPSDKLFLLDYPTQILILTSPEVLNTIAKQVQTRYPKVTASTLKDKLVLARVAKSSSRNDQTKILEVSYSGEDRKQILFVLEKTKEKYLKYSLDERKSRISQGVKFIDEQLPLLQTRVDEYRGRLEKIQRQYELLEPTQGGQALYEQIRNLQAQSQETERLLQEQKVLYQHLQEQLSLNPEEAVAASALSESPFRKQILDNLMKVETEIAIQSATFNDNSPELQQLKEQQANLLQLLEVENKKILGQKTAQLENNSSVMAFQTSIRQRLISQLVDTDGLMKSLEVKLQGLNNALNTLTQQAQIFPGVVRQYTEIQQQLDLTNKRFNLFLDEREKLRIEGAQNNVPWEVISKPSIILNAKGKPVSSEAEGPKKKILMVFVAGLGLGILLSIGLEKFRNIFYTIDDLKEIIQVPILGDIPRHNNFSVSVDLRSPKLAKSNRRIFKKIAQFLSAFDEVYANIRFLYSDSLIRSIAICSAESKDGKSTIALHLAQTIANMGQRVLLVDANLHYPQLHTVLGLSNQKGLSDLLTQNITPSAVIQKTPLAESLFVLTAGVAYANSFKLLGSEHMHKLVETLQDSYDLVIYDTPELHQYTDTIFLAEYLDGLILVATVHKTHKTVFKEVLAQLNTYRMPCIGVIINHIQLNSDLTYPFYLTPSLVNLEPEYEQEVENNKIENRRSVISKK
ncbi:MAG TPA: capsular biosynthesis protein [Planktothrix sp. UBA8402]|nr:capsular biosynthesis protein [Planktothrix sp. UBA8402]